MNKQVSTIFLIALFFSSCADAEIPQTSTPKPTSTSIPSPTFTATPTVDPLAGAPEGTTGINSNGEWTKTVIENGYAYAYNYNAELRQYVREVGTIILFDTPQRNYLPYTILVAGNVENERSFISISHQDITDINAPNNWLTRTFSPELRARYFADDPRNGTLTSMEGSRVMQMEMLGLGEGEQKQAYLDIIVANGTPEGKVKRVKLSETTGIILTILTPEDIAKLGGENVLELHAQGDGHNYTYFVEVYDVDNAGNELARMAFRDPLDQIPENILRKVLFTIPGNLVDHKDQREQGFTNVAQIFAQYSAKPGLDGKPDVVIELLPAITP